MLQSRFMSRRNYVLVFTVIGVLILPGLFWGLPSAATVQVDSPFPLGPLVFWAEYHNPHATATYPAFHQLLLLPIYLLIVLFFWLGGGFSHLSSGWPYGLRNPTLFFSVLILVTNLVSAAMGILLLRLSLRFVSSPKRAWAWVGLLVIGTNGMFVYYARVGNLDMPYVFWWGVSLFFLWGYFIEGRPFRVSLLPAALASACALGSKDQASGLILGAGVLILLMSPANQLSSTLRSRFWNAAGFSLLFLGGYVLVAILPHPVRWWYHVKFILELQRYFSHSADAPKGQLQVALKFLREMAAVYSVPVLILMGLGLFALVRQRRQRELWVLMTPLFVYYIVVIAATHVCITRTLLPFIPLVIVLVTYGAAFVGDHLKGGARLSWIGCMVVVILAQLALSYAPVTYAQVFDKKRQLAADLPALVPEGQPLLISRMQSYNFPNRNVYDNYRLMMVPNDPIVPPSRHVTNLLHPIDSNVVFYLLGSGNAGLPINPVGPYPELQGELVHEWRYPRWVKDRVLVPVIYEFALYRRTGPLPMAYRPTRPGFTLPPTP